MSIIQGSQCKFTEFSKAAQELSSKALGQLRKLILDVPNNKELYLIGNQILLTKEESVDWILSHRLDGVIVHYDNEQTYPISSFLFDVAYPNVRRRHIAIRRGN